MAQTALYASYFNYTQENMGEWLHIYQGIFQHESTRGNIIYPTLKYLGTIDLQNRRFIKGAKHPRKIVRQDGDNVYLYNYHGEDGPFTLISTLFTNLGFNNNLFHEIQNIVLISSANRNLKTNNPNRIGGEYDGIVNF